MTRDELLIRFGAYAGLAARLLGDYSYSNRWLGNAHLLTAEAYASESAEIQSRLLAAGFIVPDEDAFESMMAGRL